MNNESPKAKRIKYTKELKAKRDALAAEMATMEPGTTAFKERREAIEGIDRILHEKTNTLMNGLKIGGMLLMTAVGLGVAHWDDISDSIPGKFVSKAVDGLLNRISR